MKGMNNHELLDVCIDKNYPDLNSYPYWTSEVYGFGALLRKYGFYPNFLPIYFYTDHSGPNEFDNPSAMDIQNSAPVILLHSSRIVRKYRKYHHRPCYVLFPPFVFYRRKNKINRNVKASGTLAFPAHTTHHIENYIDDETYVKELLKLPQKYHPISACLYFLDILKGKHKIFQKFNIPVYTAGNWQDKKFPERFYNILKRFNYSTSNCIGSYMYYSVEMGTPFFLYGKKPIYINKGGDGTIPKGNYDPLTYDKHAKKITALFSQVTSVITPKQRNFVNFELGLKEGINRKKMMYLLYSSYLNYTLFKIERKILLMGIKYLPSDIKKLIRKFIKLKIYFNKYA